MVEASIEVASTFNVSLCLTLGLSFIFHKYKFQEFPPEQVSPIPVSIPEYTVENGIRR